MEVTLRTTRYGSVRVIAQGGALFFTISPGANSSTYATVRSHLPGLIDFHGRDVDRAVEECVHTLGLWVRKYIGERVRIEVLDERGADPTT